MGSSSAHRARRQIRRDGRDALACEFVEAQSGINVNGSLREKACHRWMATSTKRGSIKPAFRSTGSTLWLPLHLSELASAHGGVGQFDQAWRCIGEAIDTIATTKERWHEAEVNRVAGEIALKSPDADAAKAERYFERALAIARNQEAKSWELRSAMSMARLLRDQGKPQQARELLVPIYGWFTEGFETRDLKEAHALLDALSG